MKPISRIVCSASFLLVFSLLFSSVALAISVQLQAQRKFSLTSKPIDIAASTDGKWIFALVEGGNVQIFSADGQLAGSVPANPGMDQITATGGNLIGAPDTIILSSRQNSQIQTIQVDFSVDIDTSSAPTLGKPEAPVVITVFSDFQCPYCGRVGSLLEPILQQNPDNVKIAFKHFPLPSHNMARQAAWASMAAHQQGKFWEYHDQLFKNSSTLNDKKFEEIAQGMGLNMERFKQDMGSLAVKDRVEKDAEEGRNIGVRGTPALYVNGRALKDRSPQGIQGLIDEELLSAGKGSPKGKDKQPRKK